VSSVWCCTGAVLAMPATATGECGTAGERETGEVETGEVETGEVETGEAETGEVETGALSAVCGDLTRVCH
jgi:hypothetical protein